MYNVYVLVGFLVVLAGLLIQYRPVTEGFASGLQKLHEGFATAAVHPTLSPACTERSPAAQKLLARVASFPETDDTAQELRTLVSKLCCLEADIATPAAAGQPARTLAFQFRTSEDMEPASSFVGRCLRNAVQQRDIDLVIDKYETRGYELVKKLVGECPDGHKEFADVIARTRLTMVNFCLTNQPSLDHPTGPRDVGFWTPSPAAALADFQGTPSVPSIVTKSFSPAF